LAEPPVNRGSAVRTAVAPGLRVVGREAELGLLERFLGEHAARALTLTGAPGIGKTTVWAASIAAAEDRGLRVLSARPAEAEAKLSFAGLADLLEAVDAGALTGLPAPLRRALEVALLRAEPGAVMPSPRAVAAGVLGVLRGLARRESVVVAIDDVHWLDTASAQALAFAARRLGNDPVRFLFARRTGPTSSIEEAFAPAELARLELSALSYGAVRTLLSQRMGPPLTRRVLRQVVDASGGNPLFAIELGRMLTEHGPPAIGDELPAPAVVESVLDGRVEGLASAQRTLLLAVALSPELRTSELATLAGAEAVEEAIELELLTTDGERVRAAHPLLAAAARTRARAGERRALHLRLAAVVENEELCARHLALGTDRPDAVLADRIARAAARATARGAAGDAVDLTAHALRLTPPDSPDRSERLLLLGERLVVAGELERGRELLLSELHTLPKGPARARVHLTLTEVDFVLEHVGDSGRHLHEALTESAADPALHAVAAARWSRFLTAGLVERIAEAKRSAEEVLPDARRAGPAEEREVLHALAFARKLRGEPIDDLSDRFQSVSQDTFHLLRGVERVVADRLGTRGHVREARAEFRRLLALADERGESWSAMWLLFQLCELELRAGEWDAASRLLEECEESPDRSLIDPRGYDRCRALLAAGRGDVQEAERRAAATIAVCQAQGLTWNLLEAQRASGLAALLVHDSARAVTSLAPVWEHTEREGVHEPAEFPVAPDLVEALTEVDRLDEARAVATRLRTLSEAQQHPWGLASAVRAEALVALADTHDESALEQLVDAAAVYEGLALRFDHARTLLAAGRAARRLRKWRRARELLRQAQAAFEAIGSHGWAADAGAEFARVGGRRAPADGGLTAAERLVASLAADGRSNKEIAGALVISVSTVETHLKHAYVKLGIRSRAQLAARLAAD
jgi:DNA-binding CsgD family transcriptional regulator